MKDWEFKENTREHDGKCVNCKVDEIIIITKKAERQIRTLTKHIRYKEWMAILVGRKEKNAYIIEEMILPEQETQMSHIEVTKDGSIEAQEIENKIGWIHSHNNMGVFFSQNDLETASQQKISIVVNNKLEMKAIIKIQRPCGAESLEEIDITTENREEDDEETLKMIKEKVREKKEQKTMQDYGFEYDETRGYWKPARDKRETTRRGRRKAEKERRRRLEELEGISIGWEGTCQQCQSKINRHEETIFRNGMLYHLECITHKEEEYLEDYA